MTNDWILDVLADLKTFAERNGLAALAEQLDQTRLIAAVELAAVGDPDAGGVPSDEREAGGLSGQRAAGRLASGPAEVGPRPA